MSCEMRGPFMSARVPDHLSETAGDGGGVLLPDRRKELRGEIESLLLGRGYEFELEDATALAPLPADAARPSLVVSELGLTGPSGLDMLIRVRCHRSGTRLLLVSGGAEGPAAAAAVARLLEAAGGGPLSG
jgi:ActR/RegA family two-component response regulator